MINLTIDGIAVSDFAILINAVAGVYVATRYIFTSFTYSIEAKKKKLAPPKFVSVNGW